MRLRFLVGLSLLALIASAQPKRSISDIIKDQRSFWNQYENSTLKENLPRRAQLGFRTKPGGSALYDAVSLYVREVIEGSPAQKGRLVKEDRILSVNGTECPSALFCYETLRNLKGRVPVILGVRRNGEELLISFTPECEPLEDIAGVETTYGSLTTEDGTVLRTMLTKPIGSGSNLPGILISDWTTCSSTELPMRFQRGWINFVRGLVQKTGSIVLRVDKPGCGDSNGFCSELDFNETIAYQKEALRMLKAHPDVDPANIFIDGESAGGFIAPLVALDEGVKGIFVRAAGATTWFERMVMFERKLREYSGKSLVEIDADMKRIIDFFHYYLTLSLSLEEIFAQRPDLEEVWKNDISHNSATKHYGRPIAFHQQAQAHDFPKAWIDTGARALVLYGGFDQYESEKASGTLINAVNSVNPGYGKMIVYPNLNHDLEYFETRIEALPGNGGKPIIVDSLMGADQMIEDVKEWMEGLKLEN